MKYNLSVTLTPVEHFFFGGENRHTDGTEKYLQQSLMIPQQTTVLGAMRFLVLQHSGNEIFKNDKIRDKESAKKLIGASSFDMNPHKYGIIDSISEVLLWKDQFYYPLVAWRNKDEVNMKDEDRSINTEFLVSENRYEENGDVYFFDIGHEKKPVSLPQYKAKDETDEYWISINEKPLKSSAIFKSQIHAGNYKNKENKTENDDDAYFKMKYYRFTDNYSFVFNMELDDHDKDWKEVIIHNIINRSHFINLGGERSKFVCQIEEIGDDSPKKITNHICEKIYAGVFNNCCTQVILTSDAYIEKAYPESLQFASVRVQKMRFLKTTVDHTEAYNNRNEKGFSTSKLYNLLQRGSVFYFEKEDDADSFLTNAAFTTIGYNKFCKITTNNQ